MQTLTTTMPRLFGRAPTARAKLVRRSDAAGAVVSDEHRRRESRLSVAPASTSSALPPATLSSAASSLVSAPSPVSPSAPASLYEALLGGVGAGDRDRARPGSASTTSLRRDRQQHYRGQRARLATADDGARRRSPRKLVKEPSRSARPVAARVLVEMEEDENDGEGDGNVDNWTANRGDRPSDGIAPRTPAGTGPSLRRKMARWRALRFR